MTAIKSVDDPEPARGALRAASSGMRKGHIGAQSGFKQRFAGLNFKARVVWQGSDLHHSCFLVASDRLGDEMVPEIGVLSAWRLLHARLSVPPVRPHRARACDSRTGRRLRSNVDPEVVPAMSIAGIGRYRRVHAAAQHSAVASFGEEQRHLKVVRNGDTPMAVGF